MKIANPKHLGCPEIRSDPEQIWRRLANPRRRGVGNPPLLTEEVFNTSFYLVFLSQHKPRQASPTLSPVNSSLNVAIWRASAGEADPTSAHGIHRNPFGTNFSPL
jgi:hypothetical protein